MHSKEIKKHESSRSQLKRVSQLLCASGLRSLLPCLHLIRTVRLNGRAFTAGSLAALAEVAAEVGGVGTCRLAADAGALVAAPA